MTTRRARHPRSGERGFTLIEVLVSMAILAIIGGVVAAIYGIGLKSVAPNGPQGRLLGAHDLEILEQTLGQDGSRAACFQLPPAGASYGNCTHGFATVASADCPKATSLCIGWVQVSDLSCHVAVYDVGTAGSGVKAMRSEYSIVSGPAPPPLGSVPLARDVPVKITLGSAATSNPEGPAWTWIRSLPITITSTVGSLPPSQQLNLQPVATDPGGANNALAGGAIPC